MQYLIGNAVLRVYLLPFLDHREAGLACRSRHVPSLSGRGRKEEKGRSWVLAQGEQKPGIQPKSWLQQ